MKSVIGAQTACIQSMVFILFLIIFALTTALVRFSFLDFLHPAALFFHQTCLNYSPPNVISSQELNALVCGHDFLSLADSQIYIVSGLIHLFVVSGSHLVLIERTLSKLENKFYMASEITHLILLIYIFVCNLNPPIVRSYLFIVILGLSKKYFLHFKTHNALLAASLIGLILQPQWITSLSYQMSWIAGLTLIYIDEIYKKSHLLIKNLLFYLHFYLTMLFLGLPQVVTVVISTVLSPFLEYVLFPMAFLVFLYSDLSVLFDFLIQILKFSLNKFELKAFVRNFDSYQVVMINWMLIFALHFFIHIRKITRTVL